MPIDDRPLDQRYTDPATTQLPPTTPSPRPRVSGWIVDPDEPSGWRWMPDVSAIAAATQILPVVPAPEGRVDFHDAVDWAWPPDGEDAQVWVPPREDDWCEDRAPDELSDDDGFD